MSGSATERGPERALPPTRRTRAPLLPLEMGSYELRGDTRHMMFTTSAVLYDEDGDLQADRLGTPTAPADWLLTLRFGDQWIAPASATFDATRLSAP